MQAGACCMGSPGARKMGEGDDALRLGHLCSVPRAELRGHGEGLPGTVCRRPLPARLSRLAQLHPAICWPLATDLDLAAGAGVVTGWGCTCLLGTCFSLTVPGPVCSRECSAGCCSWRRRMRSSGLVTAICEDCRWSALLAVGRVAGEGSTPPLPPSDAVCGWGVCRTSHVLGQELPPVLWVLMDGFSAAPGTVMP